MILLDICWHLIRVISVMSVFYGSNRSSTDNDLEVCSVTSFTDSDARFGVVTGQLFFGPNQKGIKRSDETTKRRKSHKLRKTFTFKAISHVENSTYLMNLSCTKIWKKYWIMSEHLIYKCYFCLTQQLLKHLFLRK